MLFIPLLSRVMAASHGFPTTGVWVNVGCHFSLNSSGHSEIVAISWDRVPFLRVMGIWLVCVSDWCIPLVGARFWLAHVCIRCLTRALLAPFSWDDSPRGGKWRHGWAGAFYYLIPVPQFLVLRVKWVEIRNWKLNFFDLGKHLSAPCMMGPRFLLLFKEFLVWVWASLSAFNM